MSKERLIKIVICIASLILCILGIYGITNNVKEYKTLEVKKENLEKKASEAKKEFDEYKKDVQKKAYEEAQEGDSQEAKEVGEHNSSSLVMNNLSNGFFKVYFTWDDTETYKKRADKASDLATKDVIDNKDIFDDGKDNLGGDYIKTTGVKSEFINAEAYPSDDSHSLVKVNYKSWFNDKKDASEDSTRYYYVSFDRDKNKITNLELVFSSDN